MRSRLPCSSLRQTGSETILEQGSKNRLKLLVERATRADADSPEMTVLVGGMRALNAERHAVNAESSPSRPGR